MSRYIDLNRLEYNITRHCSSDCRHCYVTEEQSCSSDHIDVDLSIRILREIGREYSLDSVMTFGGEPENSGTGRLESGEVNQAIAYLCQGRYAGKKNDIYRGDFKRFS
ncbi:MAG: hypothetical protein K8S24_06180 [Candidatus Aegiribacteria sp.]|nr:hypothetical protein [Candidatus Aegiribacteria sp.]